MGVDLTKKYVTKNLAKKHADKTRCTIGIHKLRVTRASAGAPSIRRPMFDMAIVRANSKAAASLIGFLSKNGKSRLRRILFRERQDVREYQNLRIFAICQVISAWKESNKSNSD